MHNYKLCFEKSLVVAVHSRTHVHVNKMVLTCSRCIEQGLSKARTVRRTGWKELLAHSCRVCLERHSARLSHRELVAQLALAGRREL